MTVENKIQKVLLFFHEESSKKGSGFYRNPNENITAPVKLTVSLDPRF